MRGLTISQLADRYGKSKQCVNDKIKFNFTQQDKQQFIVMNKNRQYILSQGVKILDQLMNYIDDTPQNTQTRQDIIQPVQQVNVENTKEILDLVAGEYVNKTTFVQVANEYKLDRQAQSFTNQTLQQQIEALNQKNKTLTLAFGIALSVIVLILVFIIISWVM